MCSTSSTTKDILTIGTKPDGIYVRYSGTEKRLSDFTRTLDEEDKAKVDNAITKALNSCTIQKQGDAKTNTGFLHIFYGTINNKKNKSHVEPVIKLFVAYSGGHRVFVTPSQRSKSSTTQLFDELKTCIEILLGTAEDTVTGHVCGENTENKLFGIKH